jgi:hypothetical protein
VRTGVRSNRIFRFSLRADVGSSIPSIKGLAPERYSQPPARLDTNTDQQEGTMAEYVYIYSTGETPGYKEPNWTGPRRAAELGARGIGVASVADLKAALRQLKTDGVTASQMQFDTHGSPGTAWFGADPFNASVIQSQFVGNGFEDLFSPGARVFFSGCNIADNNGCSAGACPVGDVGRNFLMTFAKTFLFKAGGRVGASTSLGLPTLAPWTNKVFHLWGDTIYAYINRGGTRVRIAVGTPLSSPAGDWKVSADGAEYLYCFYENPNTVWWDNYNRSLLASGNKGEGTWDLQGDWLHIAWKSGTSETWDLPLFNKEQWGFWKTADGAVHNLVAVQTHEPVPAGPMVGY